MLPHFDVFISHATEDKAKFAEPLAMELKRRGLNVWYDGFSLIPGKSLRGSIEKGISESKCAVLVLSRHFFEKSWTQQELEGMFSLGVPLIPVLHEIDIVYVQERSPILGALVAIQGSLGLKNVADRIELAIPSKDPARTESVDVIMCVGGAVGENVLKCPTLTLGQKNYSSRHELFGGSALNYTSRLLAMGSLLFLCFQWEKIE